MPSAKVTIAEHLKSNGYRTGHVGKWHLGYTPETMPNGQGFDHTLVTWEDASTITPISFTGTAPIVMTSGKTVKRSFAMASTSVT